MGDWEAAVPPAPRRGVQFAAALGLALVAGLWVLGRGADDPAAQDDDAIAVEPGSGEAPEPPAVPAPDPEGGDGEATAGPEPPPIGAWRPIPEGPLPPGPVVASVWTGRELIVWQGDGIWRAPADRDPLGAYDPVLNEWRTVPDVPVTSGPSTGTAWTGEELIAFAVLDADGQSYDHAVAYRPFDDSWRDVAPPPAGYWAWEAAAWNGEHVVVVGAVFPPTGPEPAAVAYDPVGDTWEELPPPPVWSQGGRMQAVALEHLVVVVGETPSSVWDRAERALTAYDPVRGAWTDPEPTPYQGLWSVGLAADPGQGRVSLVGAVQEGTWRDLTGVWAPEEGVRWGALPPRRTWGQHHPELEVTSHGLVSWSQGAETAWLLDEDEQAWRPLPPSPLASRRNAAIAWTGEELLVWGGTRGQELRSDGAAWRPER